MFDLFSDIFLYRTSPLVRVDERVKLLLAGSALLAVILSTKPLLPSLLLGLSLLGLATLRLPPRLIALRLAAPLGIIGVLVLLQSLTIGPTPLVRLSFAGHEASLHKEGLATGLLAGLRVLSAVSVMLLLSFTTPVHRLFRCLYGIPPCRGWLEIALLVYRYVFVLLDRVADLGSAQRLRLGYAGARRALASGGVLAGAALLHSLDQAKHTHEAMLVRGYQGQMPLGPMPAMRLRDRWIAAAGLGLLLFAYLALEWR